MLLAEQPLSWTATSGGQFHTDKRFGILPRSWRFVKGSCLPAKLDTWEGGNSGTAVHSRRQVQELLCDPTVCGGNRQDRRIVRSPDCRRKEVKGPVLLNNSNNPAWVHVQLPMSDTRTTGRAQFASQMCLPNDTGLKMVAKCEGHATAQTVKELCEKGQLIEAVDALGVLVQTQSSVATSVLYLVLKVCVAQKNLVVGRRVHDIVLKLGYRSDAFLGNHILRMYSSQGRLQEAMDVFDSVAKPDTFMWFSIISAYAKHGKPKKAIQLYHKMRRSGVKLNSYVFVAVLQACASAPDLESGRQVHTDVLESGVPPNSFVCTCLVDMYAKCGKLEDARRVLDSLATREVVAWTAMIAGYARNGRLEDARRLFDSMASKNVVTWTAMIAGYAEHGLGQEALALYARMEHEGLVLADRVTFACLLKACASAGALQQGKHLHSQILDKGLLEADTRVGSCLVDMYAKCGRLEDARRVFDSLATKDVVAWTTMIDAYGQSNEGHNAIECFQEMLQNGVEPDGTTFICLLIACSHEGLVNEGRRYFNAMVAHHGIKPSIEHVNCLVDLLGRAGRLDEAENLMVSYERNDIGLTSLLAACRSHGDIERARRCFESLVKMDPQHAAAYMLMASTYSDAGRWTDVDRIEKWRKLAGASKKAAMAGIEVNKQVRTFVVGRLGDDILCKVQSMNMRLKEEGGHVPHTELVLKPLSDKKKEDELCGHAEKLALAYGLLNTPDGAPLLVTKNLRMCRDCHRSTEIMSRIERRDIVVRDGHRVHHFVGGSCSCGGRP